MIIKKMLDKHSPEVQEQAIKIAKSIQKPKQTKEQTKLIAQGIEKGIAEYKKQQSKKSRMRDKAKKSLLREKNNQEKSTEACPQETPSKRALYLPWLLLVISWIGFIFYSQ
jgi:hypothetical protein